MDALIAKGHSLDRKRRKSTNARKNDNDKTLLSVAAQSSLPKSLQSRSEVSGNDYKHISNKSLRTKLSRQSAQNERAKALVEETEMLLTTDSGKIEPEGDLERTWRVTQNDITTGAGMDIAATGRQDWKLDGGPYKVRYSSNGRHMAIVGSKGHAATFDWQTGRMHSEIQLLETCRDITFLHSHMYYAVAQARNIFIYDVNGVELHKLPEPMEPSHLTFLPYHFLLAATSKSGYLTYTDTSTGTQVAAHKPGSLGPSTSLAQNPHNAVIHTGHTTGVVGLWTPNLSRPAVQLLAHLGPLCSLSIDPSQGGLHMSTAGRDGLIKVWDLRNLDKPLRIWRDRHASSSAGTHLQFSQRGHLAVASGGTVNIFTPPSVTQPYEPQNHPPLYLTHPQPSRPLTAITFCPFQDILAIGHNGGVSTILAPGSGEPNFDSSEADPFENANMRREREVHGLLDKIPATMISLDTEIAGRLKTKKDDDVYGVKEDAARILGVNKRGEVPYSKLSREDRLLASGKADLTEVDQEEVKEKEKKRMRGRNKAMKRFLRKQRRNVIDAKSIAIRARLERSRLEEKKKAKKEEIVEKKKGALDIFRSKE